MRPCLIMFFPENADDDQLYYQFATGGIVTVSGMPFGSICRPTSTPMWMKQVYDGAISLEEDVYDCVLLSQRSLEEDVNPEYELVVVKLQMEPFDDEYQKRVDAFCVGTTDVTVVVKEIIFSYLVVISKRFDYY